MKLSLYMKLLTDMKVFECEKVGLYSHWMVVEFLGAVLPVRVFVRVFCDPCYLPLTVKKMGTCFLAEMSLWCHDYDLRQYLYGVVVIATIRLRFYHI